MRNLELTRPLVAIDLETTGTEIGRDRIVEIGIVRVEPGGARREYVRRVNPEMPIPPGATAVHGITDDDVRDAPRLGEVAAEIGALLAGADILGFNSLNFDLPLLAADLERVGCPLDRAGQRHVDAMRIFHIKEPRDLSAALRFYCGREHDDAHSALADTLATLDILDAQLARYDDLPRDVAGLHAFCQQGRAAWVDSGGKFVWNAAGEAVFAFGKHRGKTLRDVARSKSDRDYLAFLQRENLEKPFGPEVRRIAAEALAGRFPERRPVVGGAPAGEPIPAPIPLPISAQPLTPAPPPADRLQGGPPRRRDQGGQGSLFG